MMPRADAGETLSESQVIEDWNEWLIGSLPGRMRWARMPMGRFKIGYRSGAAGEAISTVDKVSPGWESLS